MRTIVLDSDALVGLRFEMSGGVGRMSGLVLGKAGDLYLVQRDGVDYSELLELSDLRTARFFGAKGGVSAAARSSSPSSASARPASAPVSGGRLSDKIRRSASGDEVGNG